MFDSTVDLQISETENLIKRAFLGHENINNTETENIESPIPNAKNVETSVDYKLLLFLQENEFSSLQLIFFFNN